MLKYNAEVIYLNNDNNNCRYSDIKLLGTDIQMNDSK